MKITFQKLTFELDKTDDIKNLPQEILSLFEDDTQDPIQDPINVKKQEQDNSTNYDPIINADECAKHMDRTKNWIYKHSHELPKIQNGKKGKLQFRKSSIDKYLKKHSTRGFS